MAEERGDGNSPEEKRGFVGVNVSIIMHQNPIPSAHHLFCHLGIARLVRIPEIPSMQVKKIKYETESDENPNLNPFLRINPGIFPFHRVPMGKTARYEINLFFCPRLLSEHPLLHHPLGRHIKQPSPLALLCEGSKEAPSAFDHGMEPGIFSEKP